MNPWLLGVILINVGGAVANVTCAVRAYREWRRYRDARNNARAVEAHFHRKLDQLDALVTMTPGLREQLDASAERLLQ